MLRIVWISGRARCEVGELSGDRLAIDQRAGLPEQSDNHSLRTLESFGRQLAAGPGGKALDVEDVFHADRNPEQGRSIPWLGIPLKKLLRLATQPWESGRLRQAGQHARFMLVVAGFQFIQVAQHVALAALERSY